MTKTLAIIGAGSSGIAACKAAQDAGIPYVCYEKGSFVGGNWVFNNDNGQSSCYKSLHINTSANMMSYSDQPMPSDYPDFPHHTQMANYFDAFTEKFNIKQHIKFNECVDNIHKLDNGCYAISTSSGNKEVFDYVIVANGHHWDPKYIELPGNFEGKVIHSHYYKTDDFFDKEDKVLVVGFGNSAIDIACEAARKVNHPVVISTRSRGWVFPKYLMGKPLDQVARPMSKWLPQKLQMILYYIKMMMGIRLSIGNQERFGIPKPDRNLFSDHPTISSELLYMSGHGKVSVKDKIEAISGYTVKFSDGKQQDFDKIILCTGYNISLPFLNSLIEVSNDNEIGLYHRVVHPDHKNLFFVGLIQPIGPVMPIAELQSRWITKIISGTTTLPDRDTMLATIQEKKAVVKKNLKSSPRHTLEERFYPYIELMAKLIHSNDKKAQKKIVQSFVDKAS